MIKYENGTEPRKSSRARGAKAISTSPVPWLGTGSCREIETKSFIVSSFAHPWRWAALTKGESQNPHENTWQHQIHKQNWISEQSTKWTGGRYCVSEISQTQNSITCSFLCVCVWGGEPQQINRTPRTNLDLNTKYWLSLVGRGRRDKRSLELKSRKSCVWKVENSCSPCHPCSLQHLLGLLK